MSGVVEIVRGGAADYLALAALHPRPAPATKVLILVARAAGGERAGVLVVSMPTLNGAWRELAWPGRYRSGDRRTDARRLNDEVRCLSRVIVAPGWRGMGVAQAMVRAYLARPLTASTEAVTRGGRSGAFFERAGMTAYTLPPPAREARLLDAWEACGGATEDHPLLVREARVWARSSRATRGARDAPASHALALARRTVSAQVRAFAHTTTIEPPTDALTT